MKFMVKTVSIIIVLCILIIAIVAGSALVLKKTSFFEEEKTKVTSEFIGSRIQEISELATLQHHYRKIANYQDAQKLVSYLPLFSQMMLMLSKSTLWLRIFGSGNVISMAMVVVSTFTLMSFKS